jgi:hypothetical protein
VKVWYKVCGDMYQFYQPKKNLQANFTNHVMNTKRVKKVEEVAAGFTSSRSTLSTGRRGRPSSSRGQFPNHLDLHCWFTSTPSIDGATNANDNAFLGNTESIFALLCWGFWRGTCTYAGKRYSIGGMLQDTMPGVTWIPEPQTQAVFNDKGVSVAITGCFRHKLCMRLSVSGKPFADCSCAHCCTIPQESDFHMRVVREDLSLDKRGTRSTS